MLTDSEDGMIKFAKTDQTKDAIQKVSDLLGKSLLHEVTVEEFKVVREIARKAAYAAYAAYAARRKYYSKMAAKLIELLKAA